MHDQALFQISVNKKLMCTYRRHVSFSIVPCVCPCFGHSHVHEYTHWQCDGAHMHTHTYTHKHTHLLKHTYKRLANMRSDGFGEKRNMRIWLHQVADRAIDDTDIRSSYSLAAIFLAFRRIRRAAFITTFIALVVGAGS